MFYKKLIFLFSLLSFCSCDSQNALSPDDLDCSIVDVVKSLFGKREKEENALEEDNLKRKFQKLPTGTNFPESSTFLAKFNILSNRKRLDKIAFFSKEEFNTKITVWDSKYSASYLREELYNKDYSWSLYAFSGEGFQRCLLPEILFTLGDKENKDETFQKLSYVEHYHCRTDKKIEVILSNVISTSIENNMINLGLESDSDAQDKVLLIKIKLPLNFPSAKKITDVYRVISYVVDYSHSIDYIEIESVDKSKTIHLRRDLKELD